MANNSIIREGDLDNLQALHYYGWEFPGDTWEGIPPEIVQRGLDGLNEFIRIVQWSQNKADPRANITNDNGLPF